MYNPNVTLANEPSPKLGIHPAFGKIAALLPGQSGMPDPAGRGFHRHPL